MTVSDQNADIEGVRADQLSELLARVEVAEGPDVRLDGDIAVALGLFKPIGTRHHRVFGNSWHVKLTGSTCYMAPGFTASLDASLRLCERVLPGWLRMLDEAWVALDPVRVESTAALTPPHPGPRHYATAKTPALALLCAMLKAVIAQAASPTDPLSRSGRTS